MSAWLRLPTLRQLTARLRDINAAFAHPDGGSGHVCLYREPEVCGGEWVCGTAEHALGLPGSLTCEYVPGDDTFDAVAAARRLLADARAKGYK
jgi:hypothetical protein